MGRAKARISDLERCRKHLARVSQACIYQWTTWSTWAAMQSLMPRLVFITQAHVYQQSMHALLEVVEVPAQRDLIDECLCLLRTRRRTLLAARDAVSHEGEWSLCIAHDRLVTSYTWQRHLGGALYTGTSHARGLSAVSRPASWRATSLQAHSRRAKVQLTRP